MNIRELKGKGLSLTEKIVYISLSDKFNYHQEPFYTYEKYLAEELEISERTVRTAITRLEELGYITVERRYNKDIKKTLNYYTVKAPNQANQQKPQAIHNNSMDFNHRNEEIQKHIQIAEAIQKEYGIDINTFFNQYKTMQDFGSYRAERIANISNLQPIDVVNYFEEVKTQSV